MSKLSLTTALTAILIVMAWLATPGISRAAINVESPPCNPYDFGEVEVGNSSSITLTISNQGELLWARINVEWKSGSSGDFTTEPPCPCETMLVLNGGVDVLEIIYTPSEPGISLATLLVSISDLFTNEVLSVVEIELSGGVEAKADPEIEIDIRPFSKRNRINLKSRGVVLVAALTDEDFDASTIDPKTVTFAGAKPVRWQVRDVNRDGHKDMLFLFKTQDLVELNEESTEATLAGETTDGQIFHGVDAVNIVPRRLGWSRHSLAPPKHSAIVSTWGKIRAE